MDGNKHLVLRYIRVDQHSAGSGCMYIMVTLIAEFSNRSGCLDRFLKIYRDSGATMLREWLQMQIIAVRDEIPSDTRKLLV